MRRPRLIHILALAATLSATVWADELLSLDDAISRARNRHPDVHIATAAEREADHRLTEARSARYPRVDLIEGWQRGDQPIHVFSSLLAQRRFAESDFLVDALNHPDPLDNFRSAVTFEHLLFDGGATRAAVESAITSRTIAASVRTQTLAELTETTTRAYGRVLMVQAEQQVAVAAVGVAEADVARARDRRDAGLVTDADVLAFEVQLAKMRAQQLASTGELSVASVQLNQAIGEPLDARHRLILPIADESLQLDRSTLEAEARTRPEVEQARLQAELAAADRSAARAAFLPRVVLQGAYELNGVSFRDRASGWIIGAQVRVNLFRGGADTARLGAAREAAARRGFERERAEIRAEVAVHAARARLEAAVERVEVGQAAVTRAHETQRIVRDRYASGMASVTEVLRSAEAALEAEFQRIGARVDVLVQRAALDRARGQL